MATPMFIVTGFLDSGKTTMIKDTLMEQEWIEPGLTLLLLCEEGEEEYPEEYLKEKNMAVLKIEEFDQLNTVFFKNCERNYHPAQIQSYTKTDTSIETIGRRLIKTFEYFSLFIDGNTNTGITNLQYQPIIFLFQCHSNALTAFRIFESI